MKIIDWLINWKNEKKEAEYYKQKYNEIYNKLFNLYYETKSDLVAYTNYDSKIRGRRDKSWKRFHILMRDRIKKDIPEKIGRLRFLNIGGNKEEWDDRINNLEDDCYKLMNIKKKYLK